MLRTTFCLLFCLSAFSFAQNSSQIIASSAPSSAVQVVYVVDGSTLTTYNVDPQTLQATAVGTLTLPQSTYPGVVTSPNGRFLYYSAYLNDSQKDRELYVYDTNASGVPGPNPVQQVKATHLEELVVDPSGKFLYRISVGPTSAQFTTPYDIVRNLINPQNGKLSAPIAEATYTLDSNVSGNDCNLGILGFNTAGTEMYDGIFCYGPHASATITYNQRSVDPQTGALGPDQEIYNYSSYAASENVSVQLAGNLMFAFVSYYNQGPNANLVDVYQLPNVTTPQVNCATSMLAACGDFIFGLAHPSGKYVFLTDPTNATDIGAVNLSTQQITQTSSIPYEVQQFSPDGTLAYAVNDVNPVLDVEIYGFDVSTGAVTQGGTISVPSDWIPGFPRKDIRRPTLRLDVSNLKGRASTRPTSTASPTFHSVIRIRSVNPP
jgi:hypothetical protein